MKLVVFLGAPGSGKGTQARRLSAACGCPILTTSELLKTEIASESRLGKEISQRIDAGHLVSDDIVCDLVDASLNAISDSRAGFVVLDGFPRNIVQAEYLEKKVQEYGFSLSILYFDVDEKSLVIRFSKRWNCSRCNALLSLDISPDSMKVQSIVCPECHSQGTLYRRKDDDETIIRKRLSIFKKETYPLVMFYESRSLLSRVDASQDEASVFLDIEKLLL